MIFRIDTRNIDSFVTKHFDCEKSLDLENKFDCDEILLSTLSILFSKILGPTSPKLLFSLLRSISITPFCKECPWGCAENGKNAKVVRLSDAKCLTVEIMTGNTAPGLRVPPFEYLFTSEINRYFKVKASSSR